jgi:hypothetical protein
MEKPRSLMASGGRWVLRSALIIGLASVATTVVYFTPVPGQFQLFSVLAACVVKRVAWMLKRRLKCCGMKSIFSQSACSVVGTQMTQFARCIFT